MLWYFQPVRRQPAAFANTYIEQLRDFILGSPYLSASTLNQRFATTRGFSITFQRSGLARVVKLFPLFATYLERVMEARSNAFFLNPLVLGKGNWVAPHIDCSLRSYTRPQEPPFPSKVSVLYVDVPQPFEGGTLILHRRKEVARLTPETNLLVEFVGALKHEVNAVVRCGPEDTPAARVSLVCEHYRLPSHLLEMIPEFYLNSKRKFGDFLSEALQAGGQGPSSIDVETEIGDASELALQGSSGTPADGPDEAPSTGRVSASEAPEEPACP